MKNFKENKLKDLDKIVGGADIVLRVSGVLDGVKRNTDVKLEKVKV